MSEMAAAIGFSKGWPANAEDGDEMDVTGLFTWASAYFSAAEQLNFSEINDHHAPFYCGPVMQNVGLATELMLKTMLRGCGKSMQEIKKYSHDTYKLYCDARACFDEVKFINLHISNTNHLALPEEVRRRFDLRGEEDVETRWRVYFDHLRLLDSVYDRPYRSRYVTPGEAILPETEIVLIGTKILLNAMGERLATIGSYRVTR
ncbi:hypothetical protein [Chelativorans sp. Marseille-P2723]|uniref:hypothetical protein n=1 Tax=Chelativorans sp. Marseille-P2723 TaxID=2709133 RepID=UPI001570E33B|nr:hypothetical protein [Chelativorans sp. Marseille-P2723]